MADPDQLAKAFADHYYSVFDSNRAGLAPLYQDSSLLTFEGEKFQGTNNIVQKLTSLPFQQVKHLVSTTDAQPSLSGGITVFVTGQLQTEGEQHVLKYSQVFHLMPANNSFVVTNDIFRLN